MTYDVFGGTLSLTQLIKTVCICYQASVIQLRRFTRHGRKWWQPTAGFVINNTYGLTD